MTNCVSEFVFKPDAMPSRVWQSLIVKVSKRHQRQANGALTAGKKINGVKRHFLADVLGLSICIVVHAADIGEREGAALVLKRAERQKLPRWQKVLADGGYSDEKMKNEAAKYGLQWEVIKRPEMHKFVVVPKRWVVERSVSWTMNWRSLCRQYDYDLWTTETKIVLSSVFYLSARLTEPRKVLWEINEEHERKLRLPPNNTTQNT
ncbi:hypothetical protein FACS189443_4560 [Planctomycetales bacterium]|nr:hypothetical protein FACS189443_4560 [Planctomycetales bacterium]